MNIAAWKRLSRSSRVVQLVNASHLVKSDIRAMMFIVGRLNMLLKKNDRVYIPETTHDDSVSLGAAFYQCLQHMQNHAAEYDCAIHIHKYTVYAAKKDIVLHLASLDKTNNT